MDICIVSLLHLCATVPEFCVVKESFLNLQGQLFVQLAAKTFSTPTPTPAPAPAHALPLQLQITIHLAIKGSERDP